MCKLSSERSFKNSLKSWKQLFDINIAKVQNINRKSLEIQSIPQKSLFSINVIGFWFHFKSGKMQVAASYYLTNTYLRKMELFLFQMLLNLWQAIYHTKFSKKTCACTSMCNRMVFMGKTRFNFPWKKQNLHRAYIQKPIHAEGKTTANPSRSVH